MPERSRRHAIAGRLCLAFALTASSLMLTVLPVWAGWDVNVYVRHATNGQDPRSYTPTANSVIDGSYDIVIDATSNSSLHAFQVEIQPVNPSYALADAARVSRSYPTGTRQSDRITLPWDSRSITPLNGEYQIVSRAWSQVELQEVKVTRIFVDNRPDAPSGVKVRLQNDAPVISWSPNSEPDLLEYVIYRSKDSGAYSAIGTTAGTTYKDAKAPKDSALRYLIVALRRSFVRSSGRIESPPSVPTSALLIPSPADDEEQTKTVVVPEPIKPPAVADVTVEESETSQVRTHEEPQYAPTLPYDRGSQAESLPGAEEESFTAEEVIEPRGARAVMTLASLSAGGPAVNPYPFLAAALVLVGISLHLLRAAWILARS